MSSFDEQDPIQKMVQEISRAHHQILDDWCKAYMAELYGKGIKIEPSSCQLIEQQGFYKNGHSFERRYYFEPLNSPERPMEKMNKQLIKNFFDLKEYVEFQINRINDLYRDEEECKLILRHIQGMLKFFCVNE